MYTYLYTYSNVGAMTKSLYCIPETNNITYQLCINKGINIQTEATPWRFNVKIK